MSTKIQTYWDKTKKQSRSRRKLIGKLDPETGEMIPTRVYRKHAVIEIQAYPNLDQFQS